MEKLNMHYNVVRLSLFWHRLEKFHSSTLWLIRLFVHLCDSMVAFKCFYSLFFFENEGIENMQWNWGGKKWNVYCNNNKKWLSLFWLSSCFFVSLNLEETYANNKTIQTREEKQRCYQFDIILSRLIHTMHNKTNVVAICNHLNNNKS